jgi:putative transposase
MHTTYKFRVKDKHAKRLNEMARAVNFVWNYCNETSLEYLRKQDKWLSWFDLNRLTTGCSKDLRIASHTIDAVCREFSLRRKKAKKPRLSWRSSRRSLGWVPFQKQSIAIASGEIRYNGGIFRFWQSRHVIGKPVDGGSFNQDARGRWYVNIICEVESPPLFKLGTSVGVDLGVKTTATLSNGEKFEGGQHYRRLETKLATTQRARKKKQVKAIYAKIANCRKDDLHKFTTQLVYNYDTIFVGDVSSMKLTKTRLAKSVLDAGWGMFRSMLEYKAIRLGVDVYETKESFSTVTCSDCFERTGPSGLSALGVREWVCSGCGAVHDRDVNAAKNILRFGHESLKGAALCGDAKVTNLNKALEKQS